jgi:hypothetical protein
MSTAPAGPPANPPTSPPTSPPESNPPTGLDRSTVLDKPNLLDEPNELDRPNALEKPCILERPSMLERPSILERPQRSGESQRSDAALTCSMTSVMSTIRLALRVRLPSPPPGPSAGRALHIRSILPATLSRVVGDVLDGDGAGVDVVPRPHLGMVENGKLGFTLRTGPPAEPRSDQPRSSGKSSSVHSPAIGMAGSACSSCSLPRRSTRRILPEMVLGSSANSKRRTRL